MPKFCISSANFQIKGGKKYTLSHSQKTFLTQREENISGFSAHLLPIRAFITESRSETKQTQFFFVKRKIQKLYYYTTGLKGFVSHLSILHNISGADNSFAPHSEGLLSRKCNSPVSLVFDHIGKVDASEISEAQNVLIAGLSVH